MKTNHYLALIIIWMNPMLLSAQNTYVPGGTASILDSGNGKMGIGTGAPSAKFHIQQSNAEWNDGLRLSYSGNTWDFVSDSNGDRLLIAKNQSTANGLALINGNFGIGYSSPLNRLQVGSNPAGWAGNDAVFSNSNGGLAIYTQTDQTYLYGSKAIAIRPGYGHMAIFAAENGLVGIGGNTSPLFNLDVQGFGARIRHPGTANGDYTTFRVQGPDYTNGLEIDFFGNNNITSSLTWSYGGGPGSAAIVNVNPKPLTFGTNNQGRMIIDGAGNVGIGTFSPDQKLTVNGTIHTKEVIVDLSVPAPDYVFQKDYNLLSLSEIEKYINQHKHLPEVPSAKEMETNGVKLMEMNMLLLKKVEELTLHLIELKKEVEDLKKQK
jgi:hypothetical protein